MDCLHTDVVQDNQYFTNRSLFVCLVCGDRLALDGDNIYKEIDTIQIHEDVRLMGDDRIVSIMPMATRIEVRFRYQRDQRTIRGW